MKVDDQRCFNVDSTLMCLLGRAWLPKGAVLIVMDTFKGQDNAEIKAICLKNDCELVIVPHNLINKFHPYDISIKK